ncbi:DnaJ C-terminal domain-containing protein [Xenophilus sp. Marseille-Q4582]|uniref:DnaJ C-terminal domain-containing protein n=1 Tax=Xenophilus sp. Marseille-Q4582 TaxID=2866600 RepID=UPI001CE42902|nr:DnaJ C-terminal domain-containing protein [Xenophilus sp. Marseille-Q4582]
MYAKSTAFDELGLAEPASEREIKAAWRRLASQWHPDRNPSAEAVTRMQRINRAFDAIRAAGFRNPVGWSPYEEPTDFAHAPEAPPGPPPARAADAPAADPPGASPEAGTADTAGAAPPRKPLLRRVKLTLEEAAAGCVKVLRGKTRQDCAPCEGVGQTGPTLRCAACRGSGEQRAHFFGWPGAAQACETCEGSGQVRHVCSACQGQGTVSRHYEVKVRIPAGVRPGDRLHVPSRQAGRQAPPADLEVTVQWLAHPFFVVDADGTLRCEVPVDGFAWLAQQDVQVPTLAGLQPLGLRRDRLQYVLPGQGFPPRRGAQAARPDQVVLLRPVFPAAMSDAQNAWLQQLSASLAADAPPALQEWQRRVAAWAPGRRKPAPA